MTYGESPAARADPAAKCATRSSTRGSISAASTCLGCDAPGERYQHAPGLQRDGGGGAARRGGAHLQHARAGRQRHHAVRRRPSGRIASACAPIASALPGWSTAPSRRKPWRPRRLARVKVLPVAAGTRSGALGLRSPTRDGVIRGHDGHGCPSHHRRGVADRVRAAHRRARTHGARRGSGRGAGAGRAASRRSSNGRARASRTIPAPGSWRPPRTAQSMICGASACARASTRRSGTS